jgi:hypothetical protein
MTPATINTAALWANQVSALSAQRAARALATASAGSSASGSAPAGGGGDLFADLISSLSHGAVTLPNSSTATAATAATAGTSTGTVSRAQIARDVQALSQSLSAALAANHAATSQGGTAAAATPASAAPGTTAPLGHAHGHGHGGKHENIQSLIDELNASSSTAAGTSGTATSGAVANLNSAFSKLMTDLGAAGANSSGSNPGTATALSTQSSSPPLRGLLQTLLQHVQQQGSFAASAGNLVHTVA